MSWGQRLFTIDVDRVFDWEPSSGCLYHLAVTARNHRIHDFPPVGERNSVGLEAGFSLTGESCILVVPATARCEGRKERCHLLVPRTFCGRRPSSWVSPADVTSLPTKGRFPSFTPAMISLLGTSGSGTWNPSRPTGNKTTLVDLGF